MRSDTEMSYQLSEAAAALCEKNVISQAPPNNSDLYCPPLWDGWGCWNYTLTGQLALVDCPGFVDGFDISRQAHRYCTESGEWWRAPNNKTWANYTTCIDIEGIENLKSGEVGGHPVYDMRDKRVIKVFISGYSISTLFLATALFLFFYFKQLQCTRVTLHKNLFTSYILNSIAWILYYTLAALNTTVLHTNPVWCRVLHVITQYFVTCNFFWMFCEGFYLHTIIVVAFTTGKKLLIACCVIGWCLPIIPTIIYTSVRALNEHAANRCWIDPSGLTWIIFGPIVVTLIVNSLFIFNIIRVLITKIRAVNSPSSTQHRKAVRAALILIPLLGIQFILFPLEPPLGTTWHHIFQMTSAIVVSYQGFFVALIFCFFNGEVISLLRRRWGQHRLMRSASVISATSKHRDSMYYNQTQHTIIDPPSHERTSSVNGSSGVAGGTKLPISSRGTRSNIIHKLNPFNRNKKSESCNGLVQSASRHDNCEERNDAEVNHDDVGWEDDRKDGNGNHTARIPRVTFREDSRV